MSYFTLFPHLYYEANGHPHLKQAWCLYHFYRDTAKDPTYWSKVCLYNMVKPAREATTLRRVLEPLFHYFDTQNQWSSEKGAAIHVLMYLQSLLADSGTLHCNN